MEKQTVKLSQIPEAVLPFINNNSTDRKGLSAFYRDFEIKNVFKFRDQYRINTINGQYRVKDAEIIIY